MRAKKQYGQHFLHDQAVLAKIVAAIDPKSSDIMLEIGPGRGAMTEHLMPLVQQLTAVEVDVDCVQFLAGWPINLLHADILEFDWSSLAENTRVVGNLPYNIATEIFFLCLGANAITDMHFMMQLEVAQRLVAKPGTKAYGKLSVMLQMQSEVELLFEIGPESFTPAPQVMSAFCRLKPKHDPWVGANIVLLDQIVTAAFMRRRKQCHHNLKRWFQKSDLISLGINPEFRAENLTLNDYKNLVQSIA